MPEPIDELIAQEIQAAVNAITTGAGFRQDLTCLRPTRQEMVDVDAGDVVPVNGTVLLIQGDDDRDDALSSAGSPPRTAWRQQFVLIAFVSDSDTPTAPLDTLLNRVKADIRRKLMEDPQRGGLALDTLLAGAVSFSPSPQETGVTVGFEVVYRTPENNPYVNAG